MLLTLIVTTSLYLGEIRNEWIDILLRVDGKEVLGATYRRRDKTLRAITGTADGNHVGSVSSWPVFDDLHDAIVTQRWDEAMLRAQLACALYYEGCEWLPIVRT